jgi:hypothetical protein
MFVRRLKNLLHQLLRGLLKVTEPAPGIVGLFFAVLACFVINIIGTPAVYNKIVDRNTTCRFSIICLNVHKYVSHFL